MLKHLECKIVGPDKVIDPHVLGCNIFSNQESYIHQSQPKKMWAFS